MYLESAPSFEEFYRAKYRRLFTALCLVTGDRHEAEEVAQEAFAVEPGAPGVCAMRPRAVDPYGAMAIVR